MWANWVNWAIDDGIYIWRMDCKHTPVPCSSQSSQVLFYSSFPLVHEDPEEAGNKKAINDQMGKRQLTTKDGG